MFSLFPQWAPMSTAPNFHQNIHTYNLFLTILTLFQNYRPISRLNVLSKLFEKLLEPKIITLLNSVLSYVQHGFCKYKSTITN